MYGTVTFKNPEDKDKNKQNTLNTNPAESSEELLKLQSEYLFVWTVIRATRFLSKPCSFKQLVKRDLRFTWHLNAHLKMLNLAQVKFYSYPHGCLRKSCYMFALRGKTTTCRSGIFKILNKSRTLQYKQLNW